MNHNEFYEVLQFLKRSQEQQGTGKADIKPVFAEQNDMLGGLSLMEVIITAATTEIVKSIVAVLIKKFKEQITVQVNEDTKSAIIKPAKKRPA